MTENTIDQVMCTETCPCYTERVENPEEESERTDAWYKYSELPQEQYNFHKRIFSQARKENLNINANWTIFEWSFDKENSFETFDQCKIHWNEKSEKDPSIDL